jgi:hypothetical protein
LPVLMQGIEPTNKAAERGLRQQGRDIWDFLE